MLVGSAVHGAQVDVGLGQVCLSAGGEFALLHLLEHLYGCVKLALRFVAHSEVVQCLADEVVVVSGSGGVLNQEVV